MQLLLPNAEGTTASLGINIEIIPVGIFLRCAPDAPPNRTDRSFHGSATGHIIRIIHRNEKGNGIALYPFCFAKQFPSSFLYIPPHSLKQRPCSSPLCILDYISVIPATALLCVSYACLTRGFKSRQVPAFSSRRYLSRALPSPGNTFCDISCTTLCHTEENTPSPCRMSLLNILTSYGHANLCCMRAQQPIHS